jgi:phage gp29-like protein
MKLLTLGLTELAQQSTALTIPAPRVVEAQPVDDYGRSITADGRPIVGRIYQPRILDRYHAVVPPWSPDQIVRAFIDAELGYMTAQADLFEHMEDRDGAIAGFMQTRRLAPCGVKWSIEAANDTTEAESVAELVRAEMQAIPKFRISFRKMMDAIGKGLAALWIDWQPGGRHPDTQWRIDGLHYINPKRYRFHWQREEFLILPDMTNADGSFVTQPGMGYGTAPPTWKVLIHQTQIKTGHPAKAGVLRTCAIGFLARNYAMKDWMVYCDVFGMPTRWGKYPIGSSDDDKRELSEALENFGTDGAAITSDQVKIEFVESKSRTGGGLPFETLRSDAEREIQLAILGQDQTNTHNAAGGRTQVAEGGAKVRQDLLEADCIDIEETLTAQLIKPIVGYSKYGWDVAGALCPRFKLHYEPPLDDESFIAVDIPLISVLGLPQTFGQIAKRYNRELPKGVDPNAIMKPIPQQMMQQQKEQDQQPGKPKSFARRLAELLTLRTVSGNPTQQQSDIDDLTDRSVAAGDDAIAALAEPVLAVIDRATSLQELPDKLRAAFDDLDAEELDRLVRRTMFVARCYGRFAARR